MQLENVSKYNKIVKDHYNEVRKLELKGHFPIAFLHFKIDYDPLSHELEQAFGEYNALYFKRKLQGFSRDWLLTNRNAMLDYSNLLFICKFGNISKSEARVIKDISDCIKVQRTEFALMDFFEPFSKKPYFEQITEKSAPPQAGMWKKDYWQLCDEYTGPVKISLKDNTITLRKRQITLE
jgi:hypothetical protein